MPLRIGETFAGYRILRMLGSDGMGKVYLVQHPRLPRHDALKVLRPDVSSDTSLWDGHRQRAGSSTSAGGFRVDLPTAYLPVIESVRTRLGHPGRFSSEGEPDSALRSPHPYGEEGTAGHGLSNGFAYPQRSRKATAGCLMPSRSARTCGLASK